MEQEQEQEQEKLTAIFLSIRRLDHLVESPHFISTAPFSSLQKLDMILVSAIDYFQPMLELEMTHQLSEKQQLQEAIENLANEVQEIESILHPKKDRLSQLRTELETLVINEEKETSASKMNQTLLESKERLIEEITGSSADSSAKLSSSRCQMSRNGLIGINSAFETRVQSAEEISNLHESTWWALLKEIGINKDKIEKIEAKLASRGETLKPMMENWAQNLLVGEIIEEAEGIFDAEEASRLMLSLQMLRRGLKIVRLPYWMIKDFDGEAHSENLFGISADGGPEKECERMVAQMEDSGVFLKDPKAKAEITKRIIDLSISPVQLLMRIEELIHDFPIKNVVKPPITKFLKAQRRQMFEELDEHLNRLESPKATHDAQGNHICLFLSVQSPSSSGLVTTRLKYLTTQAGIFAHLRDGNEEQDGETATTSEANRIFEKVRMLADEIESITCAVK